MCNIGQILKLIDAEHKVQCAAARQAYEKRMKTARKWVEDARRNLTMMEQKLAAHEAVAHEEHLAAIAEAQMRRDESRRAVKGERPFSIFDIPSAARKSADGAKAMPRVSEKTS